MNKKVYINLCIDCREAWFDDGGLVWVWPNTVNTMVEECLCEQCVIDHEKATEQLDAVCLSSTPNVKD